MYLDSFSIPFTLVTESQIGNRQIEDVLRVKLWEINGVQCLNVYVFAVLRAQFIRLSTDFCFYMSVCALDENGIVFEVEVSRDEALSTLELYKQNCPGLSSLSSLQGVLQAMDRGGVRHTLRHRQNCVSFASHIWSSNWTPSSFMLAARVPGLPGSQVQNEERPQHENVWGGDTGEELCTHTHTTSVGLCLSWPPEPCLSPGVVRRVF